jgi:cystathionine beta-lyase/cystathionine gamma-synthase
MDTNVILEAARRLRPRAVFLDTYCNTAEVAMPDLPSLLPPLGRLLGPRGILVLDNSALGPSCQPLRYLAHLGGPRLFVIESLNKFHQFGMDRVTGGIIWTQGGAPSGLLKTREHLGTNMPDASVLSLPAPNRALLERRLHRLGRNALDLASRLQTFADQHPHGALSHVIYPGLPSHPAHAWARSLPFPGAFFALAFKPTHQNVYFYKSFLARIMDEARRQNVQLVAGTSFGLDTTRLYLTALHATRLTSPFLRLSVGTETADEIENIARVFTTILSKV